MKAGPATPAGAPRDVRLSLFGSMEEASRPRDVRLCLLGFGSVARALCELLAVQERVLAERHGLRVLISAAGTRHGSLLDPDGMTPAEVLAAVGDRPAPPQAARPAPELLAASGADVLVELTVMGDLSGVAAGATRYTPAATGHVLEAFSLGMDVVTANKGPIAWTWPEVSAAAAASGRRVRFESTVMDGLPVFSLLEYALPDCRLLGFEAVFNATTNFIIDAMGTRPELRERSGAGAGGGVCRGRPEQRRRRLGRGQQGGGSGQRRHGCRHHSRRRRAREPARMCRSSGWSPRGSAAGAFGWSRASGARRQTREHASSPGRSDAVSEGRVRARLRAEELDIEHPLAAVSGESLGALLHTDLMADVLVSERHALVPQTAYGVYADLLHLCRTS